MAIKYKKCLVNASSLIVYIYQTKMIWNSMNGINIHNRSISKKQTGDREN